MIRCLAIPQASIATPYGRHAHLRGLAGRVIPAAGKDGFPWRHHSPPRPCRGSVTATIGFAALLPSTWTCHRAKRCNSAASSRPEQGVQALPAPPLRPPGYFFRSLARFASSASPVPTPYGCRQAQGLERSAISIIGIGDGAGCSKLLLQRHATTQLPLAFAERALLGGKAVGLQGRMSLFGSAWREPPGPEREKRRSSARRS